MITQDESRLLGRLQTLQSKARGAGVRSLSATELADLPRLYRYASSLLAREETWAGAVQTTAPLRAQVLAAHGVLYGAREEQKRGFWRTLRELYGVSSPQAIRAEWRLIALSLALIYGLAAAAWVLVAQDLALASALLAPEMLEHEIAQLQALEQGQPFRGNFTFGLSQSPTAAGAVMGNNLQVSLLFFACALLPPLYVAILAMNALMIGTYTAVAGHWGQALEISSILWCHGTLEIQAIVLAGSAGLVLVRGLFAAGPWTRAHALRSAGRRALLLMAPVLPMLIAAGLIEGYISPHASLRVRLMVAATSAALLIAWILLAGTRARAAGAAEPAMAEGQSTMPTGKPPRTSGSGQS